MRTTINLPAHLLNAAKHAAKHFAAERSVSLGDVSSELALKRVGNAKPACINA